MKSYNETINAQRVKGDSFRLNGPVAYNKIVETIAFIYEKSEQQVLQDIDKVCGGLYLKEHAQISEERHNDNDNKDGFMWAEN